MTSVLKAYPDLTGLKLAEPPGGHDSRDVDILIGLDFFQNIVDGRLKAGPAGPVAMGSIFGWILAGRVHSEHVDAAPTAVVNFIRADTRSLLENLWSLEGIGISPDVASGANKNRKRMKRR